MKLSKAQREVLRRIDNSDVLMPVRQSIMFLSWYKYVWLNGERAAMNTVESLLRRDLILQPLWYGAKMRVSAAGRAALEGEDGDD